jgi:type VI secretion system protein ImpL
MKGWFAFLGKGWFLSLVGVTALALLIWFVGPLIGIAGSVPLGSVSVRLVVIGVLLALWAIVQIVSLLRARARNRKLVDQLAGDGEAGIDAAGAASAEELATMRKRFQDALAVLKRGDMRRRLGGQWLYQLPWYLIIGPPGCGKTTALVNSGLRFPLADQFGKNAIEGTGGTRNCDWWFTDEAVLLDTAGRYTTQDSYAEVDSAAWGGFLGMLKKYRPRRPINGVLVALSLADLIQQSDAERDAHARAVRARVQELYTELNLRCPIYVLFTKGDLIAGFTEFFADMGQEERHQVWGFTLPFDPADDAKEPLAGLSAEYRALVERLDQRLLGRMQQERDLGKRRLVFSFPRQFALLEERIEHFLADALAPSRFDRKPLVRGVYFTSATQMGTPIDRVLGAIAANFGVGGTGPRPFQGSAKSFFVTRLLRDVVFAEAAVAGLDPRLQRRRLWLRRSAFAGLALVTLLGLGAWTVSWSTNRAYIGDVDASLLVIDQRIDALSPNDRDPLDVLPLLDAVRDIPRGFGERDAPVPVSMGLGLYQGDKLGSQANRAYRRMLHKVLLPRVILRLEDQMRADGGNPESLYEVLRVYLMLGEPERYEPEDVRVWVTADWLEQLPRETTNAQREALAGHLEALLAAPPVPLPLELDGALIEQARDILNRGTLAERLYERLKHKGVGEDLPAFTIPEAAGDQASLVLTRPSGKSIGAGIPALYTYEGYHRDFDPAALELIDAAAAEGWILGPQADVAPDSAEADALLEQVRELYLVDYAEQWTALLEDIDIVPARDIKHAASVAGLLAQPKGSPLRRLLEAAADQTELDRIPEAAPDAKAPATGSTDGGLAGTVKALAGEELDRRIGYAGQRLRRAAIEDANRGAAGGELPETYVSDRFRWLRDLVRVEEGQQPPIERVQQQLSQLQTHLEAVDTAQRRGQGILAAGDGQQVADLEQAAAQMPPVLARVVGGLAQDSATLVAGGQRAEINKRWTTEVLPFCREAIGDRYPFNRGSSRDTTLHDFGRLFGPEGLLDGFFKTQLAPFADTSGAKWRWNAAGVGVGIADSVLTEFQHATAIREAFFADGGKQPGAAFTLTADSMDRKALRFALDIGGQVLTYEHGPPKPQNLQWPSPEGVGRARIAFTGVGGNEVGETKNGAWAWFRLLDGAELSATGQEELYRLRFKQGGMWARLELRAASVRNPFRLDALRSFRCPERL